MTETPATRPWAVAPRLDGLERNLESALRVCLLADVLVLPHPGGVCLVSIAFRQRAAVCPPAGDPRAGDGLTVRAENLAADRRAMRIGFFIRGLRPFPRLGLAASDGEQSREERAHQTDAEHGENGPCPRPG